MPSQLPNLDGMKVEDLRKLLKNARRLNESDAEQLVLARLAATEAKSVEAEADCPEKLAEEFWEGLLLYEEWKSLDSGRRMKSTRVRQMVDRRGVIGTLEEWARRSSGTDGFDFMKKMGRLDLTGEAMVLRYPDLFSDKAKENAAKRLQDPGGE